METLATTLKDTELTDEEKELATAKALEVSRQMENEVNIETLVKAKGFADCLAMVDGDSVRVMVKTEGLDAEQAAQIKNIILEETGVLAENISVGEVPVKERLRLFPDTGQTEAFFSKREKICIFSLVYSQLF